MICRWQVRCDTHLRDKEIVGLKKVKLLKTTQPGSLKLCLDSGHAIIWQVFTKSVFNTRLSAGHWKYKDI